MQCARQGLRVVKHDGNFFVQQDLNLDGLSDDEARLLIELSDVLDQIRQARDHTRPARGRATLPAAPLVTFLAAVQAAPIFRIDTPWPIGPGA